jgi:molybdopterin synthase sulfur carrier subunit
VKLLYFAWVRQKIGRGEEVVDLPADVRSAGDLVAWLVSRGSGYAEALADLKRVRIAINQEHANLSAPVGADDEVAFFPPVTGG